MNIFETTNFFIRNFQLEDSGDCEKFLSDKDVMRFVGDGGFNFNKTTAREIVKWFLKSCENDGGLGTWAIEHKQSGDVIGNCHLSNCSDINEIEFGLALEKGSWGKGYGLEVCSSLIEYGLNHLRVKSIVATVHKENLGSKKMLEKLNYHFDRNILLHGIEQELFRNRMAL